MSLRALLIRMLVGAGLLVTVVVAPAPAAAASCFGASHDAELTNGVVSPNSGDTSTTFNFKVRYSDNASCVPASVTVSVPGVGNFAMSARGGSATSYQHSMKLPKGTFAYTFTAVSGTGQGYQVVSLSSVSPGKVKVSAPEPKATASPKPTSKATPKATPKPTPKATPKATAAPATAEPTKSPKSARPKPTPAADATPTPGAVAGTVGVPPPRGPTSPIRVPETGLPLPWLFAWLTATAGGLTLFFVLGRRPEHETAPSTLAVSAAGAAAAPVTETSNPRRRVQTGDESQLPRWLRPSVQAARYGTPTPPADD